MPTRVSYTALPDAIPVAGLPALPMRLHGARRPGAPTPVVLHLHGGAFVGGDLDSGESLAQLLAQAGAVVVSIAYPLAPEHPFPVALEASYVALQWIARKRLRLGGAGAPLFVAGEEAGGNLAAALALGARDRGEPRLEGQILVTPMLDPCSAMPSKRAATGGDVSCKWSTGWSQYLRKPMDAEHPYAVPAHASRLGGLPPALVLAGEDDPMRDEARAYAERLRQAGVVVRTALVPATGWPQSLEAPPHSCPCEQAVIGHLRGFLDMPATPS